MVKFARYIFCISFLIISVICSGCASTYLCKYIKDKNPYKRDFYISFDKCKDVLSKALKAQGWIVLEEVDPNVYEHRQEVEEGAKQVLLLTDQKRLSLTPISWARLNIYLSGKDAGSTTSAEIRFVKATRLTFKTLYGYRYDAAVESIYKEMEAILQNAE